MVKNLPIFIFLCAFCASAVKSAFAQTLTPTTQPSTFSQSALTTYLNTDPSHLGFAPYIAAINATPAGSISGTGNFQAIANLINATSPYEIAATYITKDNMLLQTIPIATIVNQGAGAIGADGIHTITAVVAGRWTGVLENFRALDQGTIIQFSLFNTLGLNAVGDNVLTSTQAAALGMETGCTWAEDEWGQGFVVTEQEVQAALGY